MTKLEKMAQKLNEEFRVKLAAAMKSEFDIDVESNFDLISMRLVTTKADGTDFTKEQHDFIGAFSSGYGAAMSLVRD